MFVTRIFLYSLLSLFASSVFADDAALIEKFSGKVSITGADGKSRSVGGGDKVGQGETIVTAANSDALLKAADGSVVVLRPNTQFQFVALKYEGGSSDSALLKLFTGTARMITGLIGKNNRDSFRLQTTTATIGIRGTDFEVAVIPEGSADGRAGVYDFVHDGGTTIKLAGGQSLDVNADQTGFAPDKLTPGEAPLQLLDKRPAFFKGGGFDTFMHQMSMQPMRSLQQMRR